MLKPLGTGQALWCFARLLAPILRTGASTKGVIPSFGQLIALVRVGEWAESEGMPLRPPLRLALQWSQFAASIADVLSGGEVDALAAGVESLWINRDSRAQAVAALSVRSAFDLLLQALRLEPGSDILFSAINVPGMMTVAEAHGLRVCAVDIDSNTLAPSMESLRRTLASGRPKVFLFAHLLGAQVDLDETAAVCREHGVLLVEDCAQAWRGDAWRGHPGAIASLFSFGPIKTGTALGGAVATIRDAPLAAAMRSLRDAQPFQSEGEFARRILKFAALKALSHPLPYGVCLGVADALRIPLRPKLTALTRGFGSGSGAEHLLPRLRKRPCGPQLRLLMRRLLHPDADAIARRAKAGDALAARLDFIAAENSMGFHAPQEASRVLAEAIDYARQGEIVLLGGAIASPSPAPASADPDGAPRAP